MRQFFYVKIVTLVQMLKAHIQTYHHITPSALKIRAMVIITHCGKNLKTWLQYETCNSGVTPQNHSETRLKQCKTQSGLHLPYKAVGKLFLYRINPM